MLQQSAAASIADTRLCPPATVTPLSVFSTAELFISANQGETFEDSNSNYTLSAFDGSGAISMSAFPYELPSCSPLWSFTENPGIGFGDMSVVANFNLGDWQTPRSWSQLTLINFSEEATSSGQITLFLQWVNNNFGFFFTRLANNKIQGGMLGATQQRIVSDTVVDPNEWYLIITVSDGTTTSMFINNVTQSETKTYAGFNQTANYQIGPSGGSQQNKSVFGLGAHVWWSDYALTAQNRSDIYNFYKLNYDI